MTKILVVDDDTRLRNLLGKFLNENNFIVSLAKDTEEARSLMDQNFDLMIIDVMMPTENGVEFTNYVRTISRVPIIMLTARGEPDDRIKGLEAGADDYMPKPFEPKELLLRINNILKRLGKTQTQNHQFGKFIFDIDSSRLKSDEEFIHITQSEAKILKILCEKKGAPVSREEISNLSGDIDERSVDVQITRLRRKIEENPKQPQHLQTLRNRGYVLHD